MIVFSSIRLARCVRLTRCMAPALALAALALPACKPAAGAAEPVSTANEPVDLPPALARQAPYDERVPGEDAAAPADDGAQRLAPRVRVRHGTIERAALDAVLDRGPGAFLGGLELKPHFRDRRFTGWEIVRIRHGERRIGDADLQPGDVVTMINDRIIVRPRHLQALWVELRAADAIVVQARRDGQPFELRFDVIDTPGAPAP